MAEGLRAGLVLGGGVAGMLAGAVLADALGSVTIVERDHFGDGPRKGVPQARHAHLLLSSGARAIDELVPGTTEALLDAGAHRIGMPSGLLTFTPYGWTPRIDHDLFLISCTRTLLESVLRERVLRDKRITVLQGSDAVGLAGDPGRITATRVRDRATGEIRPIGADLIVDATGASSKAPQWLTEIGVPAVEEEVIDSGVAYATRFYRPPVELAGFPAVCVQPDPNGPAHGGVLLPVEDGRWMVSVAGLRGFHPPTEDDGHVAFAGKLRHPLIGEMIAAAEPLSSVRGYRAPANRLRRFDRLPLDGFVVLGDAACSYNPLYGHGMSVAARGALALRDALRERGRRLAHRAQRAVIRVTADAWALASGQDLRYAGTAGPRPGLKNRIATRYADRVGKAAAVRPGVTRALLDAYTLTAPLSTLLGPKTALSIAFRLPGRPSATPPLTTRESVVLQQLAQLEEL